MYNFYREDGIDIAIPTNIKTLLLGNVVEWARIEFKESWDAETSLKTICAFANDIDNWGGGYLIIGVKDKEGGEPDALIGVNPNVIDEYLKDMLNKCKLIQPEYMPIVEVVDYLGKKYIVVWAPGGSMRPYSSPKTMAKDNRERFYYIRKMASTIVPSQEEIRDLFSLANNVPFDDRINHEADINDLNITLIQQYLKEIGSCLYEESKTMPFFDLCKSMNIVNVLPEYIKPKNVGLMFFSHNPEKYFPYAQIDVVQFPKGLGGDVIIENTFKGPLHHQLRSALQYISNYVIQERVVKLPNVAEANRFYNFPYSAVEESLSNAVYHKGYNVREPIEVRILPDRMEILSHPGADRSITEDGLKNYRVFNRRYRNRRIGEFLKEMHLTEGRNTGFRKILNSLEYNGSPKPVFYTDPDRLSFSTTIFIHPEFLDEEINEEINEEIKYILTDNEQKLLKLIRENPTYSINNLKNHLCVSKITLERIINSLKDKGIIERQGSRKNGKWIVNKTVKQNEKIN